MSGNDVHRDDMFDEEPTLAAFARDLQDAAAATPAPAIGASLAAVLEGGAPATEYPEVVETPRARVVRRPARLRWAVGIAALAIGTSSLGVAGALPAPVQRQVARIAQVVGIDVPDGEDDAPRTTVPPTSTTSTTIATTTSTAPPVGTTLLGRGQDAGEDRPGKPDTPGRSEDDDDRRGRGRGGHADTDHDDDPEDVDDGTGSVDLDDADEDRSGTGRPGADVDVDEERSGASGGPASSIEEHDEDPDANDDLEQDEGEDEDATSSEQA